MVGFFCLCVRLGSFDVFFLLEWNMVVKCVVVNIVMFDFVCVVVFYGEFFGMLVVMDYGWIVIYGG